MFKKKLLTGVLAAAMVVTSVWMAPITAYADENATVSETEAYAADAGMDEDGISAQMDDFDSDFAVGDDSETVDDINQGQESADDYVVINQNTQAEADASLEATKQDTGVPCTGADDDHQDPLYDRYNGNATRSRVYDTDEAAFSGPDWYDGITHSSVFSSCAIRRGVDVSKYNGNSIDWNRVKSAGIDFVFVRIGYSRILSGEFGIDPTGLDNIKNARAAGLKVGAYFFSTATTTQEATAEAQYSLGILNGIDLDLPVVMDYEFATSDGQPGRLNTANLSKDAATANVMAFCDTINSSKYTAMLYASRDYLNKNVNSDTIAQYYPIWLAEYNSSVKKYTGRYNYWQFSSSGYVDGIGGAVDLDVWYDGGYTGLAKKTDGQYHYLINGVEQNGFNGFIQYVDGRWYRVDGGVVNYSANGLYPQVGGDWYYCHGGVVDWSFSGIAPNIYGDWYAVKNGRYNPEFTGLAATYNGGFAYAVNGILQKNFVGFKQYRDGRWYYVDHGFINYGMTGLCPQVGGGWYYARGGVLDWRYNGLAQNIYGDWYAVTNGQYNPGYTGLLSTGNGFGYVKNGSLQKNFVGFVQYQDGRWYYVDHGFINYGMTGLCPQVGGGWYYARGGVLDWKFTGLAQNIYGDWYAVKNGCYDGGFTGLMSHNGNFYYVRNGLLRWDYTGFAQYSDGRWYYVRQGNVKYWANGLYYDQYGQAYYVQGGRINWGYNGTAPCEDGHTYFVRNGKKA